MEQERWAQEKIAGACPGGEYWHRVPSGYRCNAIQRLVTDELLAEGKGGCIFLDVLDLAKTGSPNKVGRWYFGP